MLRGEEQAMKSTSLTFGLLVVSAGYASGAPVAGLGEQVMRIESSLGAGDFSAASQGLDGLYSGSLMAGGDAGAVSAGEWAPPHKIALKGSGGVTAPSRMGELPPLYLPIECGDGKSGCQSAPGKIIDDATKPLQDAIDRLGDRLRDRNDEKLREGTQRQRDAEKAQKERKEKR